MPQAKFICNIKYYFLLHFGSYRPIDVQDCISEEALCKSSLINTHGMEAQFITLIYTPHWFHFVMAYKHRFRILLMHVYLCLYKNLYIYLYKKYMKTVFISHYKVEPVRNIKC
jgi:hypothetical protein